MSAPRPADAGPGRVREAYDAGAEDLAARLPDARFEAAVDLAMVDALADAVGGQGDAGVLDAGCGGGRMSGYLTGRGCDVEGMDLSPGMVAVARRKHPDLRFTVGALDEMPYPDASFAGVLLWYSMIHTAPGSLGRVFAEVRRVLRPGGHVLVGFQCGVGMRDVPWAHDRGLELDRHLHAVDDVADSLEAAGLRELCRLVRRPRPEERDDQAFLLVDDPALPARAQ